MLVPFITDTWGPSFSPQHQPQQLQHQYHQQHQHHQLQGARANLTGSAFAGAQIIARKDQLIVLPNTSSSLPVCMGHSVRPTQANAVHLEQGAHGVNVIMAPGGSGKGKGTMLNLQSMQDPGAQGANMADRRHGAIGLASGGVVEVAPHGRGVPGFSPPGMSRGQLVRQMGGDRPSDGHVIDLTSVSRANAEDALSHLEGNRGGQTSSSTSHIQKVLRIQNPTDRHQSIQDALLGGGASEPDSGKATLISKVCGQGTGAAKHQGNPGEQPSDMSRLLSNSNRLQMGTTMNGIHVLLQMSPDAGPNGLQTNADQLARIEQESHNNRNEQTMAMEALDSGQNAPDGEPHGAVQWKCVLRSKPTPQRPDQELFTVVGWVRQSLVEKLPATMTVADFEDQQRLDCWPTEVGKQV